MSGISDLIKNRRIELNLRQEDVAKYVSVSAATVARWESGNIKSMRQDRVTRLAEILQLNPLLLIEGADPDGGQPIIPADDMTAELLKKINSMSYEELLELRGFIAGRFGK